MPCKPSFNSNNALLMARFWQAYMPPDFPAPDHVGSHNDGFYFVWSTGGSGTLLELQFEGERVTMFHDTVGQFEAVKWDDLDAALVRHAINETASFLQLEVGA